MMTRLFPVLALVVAGAVFFGYISPTYNGSIVPLQTQIQSDNDALKGAKAFADKEAALTQEQNKIPPEQLDRLKAFLPDGVDNVQLILDLDALAARSGVQLSGFDVKQTSDGSSDTTASSSSFSVLSANSLGSATNSLDLSVTATGSYAAFRSFLGGVEQSLRPLDVTEVAVADSATGIYTYTMNIRLYWLH